MEKFERKKAVYNEEIEKQLSDIINYYDWCESKEDESIISDLLDLYEETKYPGILHYLGTIYLYGQYKYEIDEEKAIKYLTQAAHAGYLDSMDLLGEIYKGKAQQELEKAKYWYDMLGLDYNDANGKLSLGNILISDYLISSTGTQYNNYDQYYTGVGLVAESFQMGCSEADIILKVLDKDQEFINDYKNRIEKDHIKLIHKIYSCSELDFDHELEEFLDDDEELPF